MRRILVIVGLLMMFNHADAQFRFPNLNATRTLKLPSDSVNTNVFAGSIFYDSASTSIFLFDGAHWIDYVGKKIKDSLALQPVPNFQNVTTSGATTTQSIGIGNQLNMNGSNAEIINRNADQLDIYGSSSSLNISLLSNGNTIVGGGSDNGNKLQIFGKASVSDAPVNPTDLVRKTDLEAAISAIPIIIKGTFSLDFSSLSPGSTQTLSATISGALTTDMVIVQAPSVSGDYAEMLFRTACEVDGLIKVSAKNLSPSITTDLTSTTFNYIIIR